MRKTLIVSLAVLFALTSLAAVALAKDTGKRLANYEIMELPEVADVPSDLRDKASRPSLASAVVDTFHLAWYSFDGAGVCDDQGWVNVDRSAQLDEYWHVADATELDGGTFGGLQPIEGLQSMWCGVDAQAAAPYCGFATLPGYANSWDQWFVSKALFCDSVEVFYKIRWDSEAGYDRTTVQYEDQTSSTWVDITTINGGAGLYDGVGELVEGVGFVVPNANTLPQPGGEVTGATQVRFNFHSDGAWSDEDGLWPTDGATLLDSITIVCYDIYVAGDSVLATDFSDFEVPTAGVAGPNNLGDAIWQAQVPPGFGPFGALYSGITSGILQEDPCFQNFTCMWAWFDPAEPYTCHTPNPVPTQGSFPYGPNSDGLYMYNEIWSPQIDLFDTGGNPSAGDEWRLSFLTYRDLPLDNLQFYIWAVRSWTIVNGSLCPGTWNNDNFVFYGGQRDWLRTTFAIGTHVDASVVGTDEVQVAVGAIDMCGVWGLVFGTCACHSHAPLIDEVSLVRVNTVGPQIVVRQLDLFQDNFAGDGTITGTARADCANDILPSANPSILPGDSISLTASPVGSDAFTGQGPAAYCYVAVRPLGQAGKAGVNMEAPETRAIYAGQRWPLVAGPFAGPNGDQFYQFRMDSAVTTAGGIVADRWCFDLNDNLFTPGDTVQYFFGINDGVGNTNYWHRTLAGQGGGNLTDDFNEALGSPCEMTMLPAGGFNRGGDILYVDDTDDRGGPAQLFFDSAWDILGVRDEIDRYDVLGPSSNVGNGLGSRVTNVFTQIIDCYRKIMWNSGNLSTGLIGDGGPPNGGSGSEKTDSWFVLFTFLDQHPDGGGLYLSGDDIAEEWAGLTGANAIATRSTYMNYNLAGSTPGNHVQSGEPVSPLLYGVGTAFAGGANHQPIPAGPDTLVAYGGCALINDFDLLTPTGDAVAEMASTISGQVYVASEISQNAVGDTVGVILSGFSYHYIRDDRVQFPNDRTEHMADIIDWLDNLRPTPVGIDDKPQFANRLDGNYPNPFNPTTTIKYSIKERAHVSLKVYDVSGRLVKTLVNEVQAPRLEGFAPSWDGHNNAGQPVASGVYFYKLVTKNFTQTKKMVLLK